MIELINIDDGWHFITEYRGIANIVGKYGAIATLFRICRTSISVVF